MCVFVCLFVKLVFVFALSHGSRFVLSFCDIHCFVCLLLTNRFVCLFRRLKMVVIEGHVAGSVGEVFSLFIFSHLFS